MGPRSGISARGMHSRDHEVHLIVRRSNEDPDKLQLWHRELVDTRLGDDLGHLGVCQVHQVL